MRLIHLLGGTSVTLDGHLYESDSQGVIDVPMPEALTLLHHKAVWAEAPPPAVGVSPAPKAAPKAEPKPEPKVEARAEPRAEPKAEPRAKFHRPAAKATGRR